MKPQITEAEERLIAAYTEAALRISRELQSFKNPKDKARILLRIEAILRQIDELTATYIREELPQRFKDGSAVALAELRKLRLSDLETGFTDFDKDAVQQLADDAKLKFAEAIQAVKRTANVQLSEVSKEFVMQQMMVSQIDGMNPMKVVKQILEQQGITALRSGNRTWTLEDYSDMLVRATVVDAQNAGAASRYAANGIEFARVIEQESSCPICQPMRGKIIWLGDPRLRPPYHPRCRGGIEPVREKPDNPIRSPDDSRLPRVTRDAIIGR